MAVAAAFKQPCPVCEALVPIKDAKLIGKKIECPKCKGTFVVESPTGKGKQGEGKPADAPKKKAEPAKGDGKKKSEAIQAEAPKKKSAPPAKGKPSKPAGDDDEPDEVGDADEAITAKPKANAKANGKGVKPAAKRVADEDDEDEDDKGNKAKGKKKKGLNDKSKKLFIGLGLAAVGLVVLVLAAVFMRGKSEPNKDLPKGPGGAIANAGGGQVPVPQGQEEKKETGDPKKVEAAAPVEEPLLAAAGPELTNLLPAESEHVAHLNLAEVLKTPLGESVFQVPPGQGTGFNDDELKAKLGFSLRAVDTVLRAESYRSHWSFNVIHSMRALNEKAIVQAFDLKPAAGSPVQNQAFYEVSRHNPWLERFGRFSLNTSPTREPDRPGAKRPATPLLVRIHDRQTLIVADAAPMLAFLREGRVEPAATPPTAKDNPPQGGKPAEPPASPMPPKTTGAAPPTPPKTTEPGAGPPGPAPNPADPKTPDAGQPAPGPGVRVGKYATLKPTLKTMLEKVETFPGGAKARVLFVSATEMDAGRMPNSRPEDRDRLTWQPRQMWDVLSTMNETTNRIRVLGTGVLARDTRTYLFQNDMDCGSEAEAKALKTELTRNVAPTIAAFFSRFLDHPVEIPGEPPPPEPKGPGTGTGIPTPLPPSVPGPTGQPNPKGGEQPVEDAKKSRVRVVQEDKEVEFILDLILQADDTVRFPTAVALLVAGLRSELDASAGADPRHALAKATRTMAEQGIPDKEVQPGHYPYGAFKRKERSARQPDRRVSWMAGLLPFLGHETLYQNVNFDKSWKDPANWLAARTLVPQFLDPTYPDSLQRVSYPGIPLDVAATHFVGVAGVGLDAADYAADDPATADKLGVLGYDRSLALEAVKKGRGLSNTIVIVQVPPDGLIGVTPWMAGGGSTLRGVPEKNSIRPFVGNHGGKRGTYVLMTDGSVRYLSETIADDVFKNMCTVNAPPPAKTEGTLVPEPRSAAPAKKDEKKPAAAPREEKKAAPPDAKEKKDAAPDAKAAPQAWLTPEVRWQAGAAVAAAGGTVRRRLPETGLLRG